jgi:hypothetical protein
MAAPFILKLGQIFYVHLNFFEHVRKNPGLFLDRASKVAQGKVIALSEKATLEFVALVEVMELSLKKFQKIVFHKQIPPHTTAFVPSDFVAADPGEYFLRVSKCVKFMGDMKSQGARIESPSETLDLYSESCTQTRSKRLKKCLLKYLEEPAATPSLEKKKAAITALMSFSTPLFDPAVAFMELWMILAKKIYLTLGMLRHHEEAVIELHSSRLLVENAVVTYLQIAGWDEVCCESAGSFKFKALSLEKVQDSFANSDLSPDMTDPLKRIFFVKSEQILQSMKNYAGIYMRVALNPRDPKLKKEILVKMAVNEVGRAGLGNVKSLSKCAIAKKIVDHRIQQKTFLGFKTLRKVAVNAERPFVIEIKPASYGRSLLRLTFHVTCFNFKVSKMGKISCSRSTMA